MVLSLLISHGSRDPRPQQAIESLALELSIVLNRPVASAVLELGSAPLHEQILALQDQFPSHDRFQILPLFLLPGAHTMEDIPAELALVRERIAAQERSPLALEVLPYLGAEETLWPCGEAQRDSFGTRKESVLLLAHGSRRSGGNGPVEALAGHLGALVAYWSVEPSLKTVVMGLLEASDGGLGLQILPYFLFPGGITDAIGQQLADLQAEHPGLAIEMGPLLSETSAFVGLVERRLQVGVAVG